jgi:glycosyltransferase involved in cell wall biosynthesis
MRKINLLYVITKLELGGAQKQLLYLIGNLNQANFRIFLFTAQDGMLLPQALGVDGLTVKRSRFLNRSVNPLLDFITLIELCVFIKRNKIQIVHTHSSKAGIIGRWAARLSKVKVIIHTVHGWSFNNYQFFLKKRFYIWLEKITSRFTDIIVVVSDYDKNTGLLNRIGSKPQYKLLRYGVNDDGLRSDRQGVRQKLGVEDCEILITMVACFKPQKAPQDFIKLASIIYRQKPLSRVKFLLVGDGVLRAKVKRLVNKQKFDRKVMLAGWREDVMDILSASDIFVLTSLWEGMPITVLESMKLAKPVVVTNTGGIAEVVEDRVTGFLVKTKDILCMSERVVFLLENESLAKAMGNRAREKINRADFSVRQMFSATEELYSRIIGQKICCDVN